MSILTPSAFVGKFAISKAFNDGSSKIQEYIDYYETYYLNHLFGAELCTLFLTGYEDEEIYTVLYDPFALDSCKGVVISEGVFIMLKCLIFAHYIRQDLGTSTANGHINIAPEGGQAPSDNSNIAFGVYNEGIETYRAIQVKIKENKEDYPEFKGVDKQTTFYI
jgi:hypothetical protein